MFVNTYSKLYNTVIVNVVQFGKKKWFRKPRMEGSEISVPA